MTHAAITTLANERYMNLETFKKNGEGVKTPVWLVTLGEAVYVFTDGTSFKVKRLRRDPRARIAGCNASGKAIHTAWFDAKGTILTPGAEQDAAYAALRKKYGFQMWLLDVGSKIGGRFGRRAMIRLDPA